MTVSSVRRQLRFAVCTLWTAEIAEYARITMPNKRAYCRHWGYEFIERTEKLDDRPPAWSKLPLLQALLPSYDWVFWTDADALFMRQDIALTDMIDDAADFIWSEDINGPNAGQFFLRSCPASFELLRAANARDDLTDHPWWEQEALRQSVAAGVAPLRVKVVPLNQFNSPEGRFVEGDFIVHMPGAADKLGAIRRFAQQSAVRDMTGESQTKWESQR